jgi:OmpA-OmpF porin, OOP family
VNTIKKLLTGATIGSLLLCAAVPGKAQQQDVEGSKDHSLISRYPGSIITGYDQKDYDEFTVQLGKVKADKYEKSQHLEGKVTRIVYSAPSQRSVLEVQRNYQSALQGSGFQILFSCAKDTCGDSSTVQPYGEFGEWFRPDLNTYFTSAKLSRTTGDVYVTVFTQAATGADPTPVTELYLVEMKPMDTGLVTVNAASLDSDITKLGHASVYGIYFDTGKADVKPESDATLNEIAKLLQQDANLKLYVVGHTDNVGAITSNMDLSKRRGDAVVKVLTTKYNIVAARLSAQGDGPTAPVASNDTEDGRAKNRRVELVKQ